MYDPEHIEIERRWAQAGLNPMFGEWRHTFGFAPVSYSNGGNARAAFRERIRGELRTEFAYVGQVTLTATLYLDEQVVLESDAYGDLDNYAKSILDALKGAGGMLIDDCQIQRLDISWIDVPKDPRFEIELRGSPDDFQLLPLKLFAMPDGLYYPISSRAWTKEGPQELEAEQVRAMLDVTFAMTAAKKRLRHELRIDGMPQFRAFQHGKYVSPTLTGFHRTRAVGSGYDVVELKQWQGEA